MVMTMAMAVSMYGVLRFHFGMILISDVVVRAIARRSIIYYKSREAHLSGSRQPKP
jgi:hypothetical protein